MNLPNEGAWELDDFMEESAKKYIMGDSWNVAETLTIHNLNLECQLMFWIYTCIILPR